MYKKIGVYFIFQPEEIRSTLDWLDWVYPQCDENTQLFGIVNGRLDDAWKEKLLSFQYLNITFSNKNRGVAGGRNIVVSEAVKWGAELLVSLDNDILVPKDYFRRMASEFAKLKASKPNLGIITPTIFDINSLVEVYSLDHVKRLFLDDDAAVLSEKVLSDSAELSKKDYFYHLGASGWKGCYLVSSFFNKFYEKKRFKETVFSDDTNRDKYLFVWHKSKKEIRDGILEGNLKYLKADTLPGGLHVYESSYIKKYGLFDERFNPYGFEDSEMCIRGIEDGLEHYLIGDVFVAHDLDQRFQKRNPSITFFTRGKVRRIIIKKHIKSAMEKYYLWHDTMFLYPKFIYQSSDESWFRKFRWCFNLLYGFVFVPKKRLAEYIWGKS